MNSNSLAKPIKRHVSGLKIRLLKALASVALISVLPSTGWAQADSPFPSSQQDGVGAGNDAAALPQGEDAKPTITVTRSACKQLVKHVPDDDVAYQSGVDVRGNKVAPADLNGGSNILNSLPKEIEFPVTVDFFEYSGISVPDGVSGEQSIGKISYRNGRVYFNDQPLGDDGASAELIEACRQAGFR